MNLRNENIGVLAVADAGDDVIGAVPGGSVFQIGGGGAGHCRLAGGANAVNVGVSASVLDLLGVLAGSGMPVIDLVAGPFVGKGVPADFFFLFVRLFFSADRAGSVHVGVGGFFAYLVGVFAGGGVPVVKVILFPCLGKGVDVRGGGGAVLRVLRLGVLFVARCKGGQRHTCHQGYGKECKGSFSLHDFPFRNAERLRTAFDFWERFGRIYQYYTIKCGASQCLSAFCHNKTPGDPVAELPGWVISYSFR